MTYSDEDIEQMKKKLKELIDLQSFQIDMGEDPNIVSEKIRELEQILNKNK